MSLKIRLVKIIKLTLHFYLNTKILLDFVYLVSFLFFYGSISIKWIVLIAAATKCKKSKN